MSRPSGAGVYKQRVEAWCHKRDRYGREVCSVFVNLRDVGLEQIRQGIAVRGRHGIFR